nr:hypothetical protein [Tanacetum cinerariifolium]
EEFVQSIQTFLTYRKNLATALRRKKKTTHLLILNVRFTSLPLYYSHDENILNTLMFVGKDGKELFGMLIPDALLTNEIKGAPYYSKYQEHVAKYQQYLDVEHGKAEEGGAIESPKATKVTKPKEAKAIKLAGDKVDEPSAEDVPVEEPAYNEEEANLQQDLELSLNEQAERTQGTARPVVIREPDTGRIQPLPNVQGKGKEKVVDEQVAYVLLTLLTLKKKSHVDQFIFQRRTPMLTEASGHAECPSLDAELALTDNEMKSDNLASKIDTGYQDKGQARPNPGVQDEGQAGSNPGDAVESQPQSSHVVHAGPNRKHMDLEDTSASTRQYLEKMEEEFTITAYPKVQENLKLPYEDPIILEEPASSTGTMSSLKNLEKELSFTYQFFLEKQQEEEPGKTNPKAEVQSVVSVPI